MDWKSRRNYKKSGKAKSIYAIVKYANWCVCEYKFADKFVWDEFRCDYIPLVYHYHDFNGERETYDIRKITNTTSGIMAGWTFHKGRAEAVAYGNKILEEVNYGTAITV